MAVAPWVSVEIFIIRDIVWFIDTAVAVSAFIRGAAKPEDIDRTATTLALQNAYLRQRPWLEWIDSDSNPSMASLAPGAGSLNQGAALDPGGPLSQKLG